jgi:hypothetical protein
MSRAAPTNPRAKPREHPWERSRRLAFARWETEVRRAPYGGTLPDTVGFASTIEPPPHWSDPSQTRRLFALSALPTGAGSTFLAAVSAGQRRPADGSLVRLSRAVKRALPGPEAPYGELLIEARGGTVPASWDEILEGISPRTADSVVPQLSELLHVPSWAVETLLLPLVGSTPWHGQPAGLDLYVEVEGWSLARYRGFLSRLLTLVPDWVTTPRRFPPGQSGQLELVSGMRIRRRSVASARPFAIQIRSVSDPPISKPTTEAGSRSVVTYGRALTSEFENIVGAGQSALLLKAEEASRIPQGEFELPDALRAATWGLHWWTPDPPDAPDWHEWVRTEGPRLRHALDALPIPRSSRTEEPWSAVVGRREFRDRLAQATIARARLRAAREVEETDLARTVDSFIRATEQATAWAKIGRGPLARTVDRTEGGRTTRLRHILEDLFYQRPDGLTREEVIATLPPGASTSSEWEVENQLEHLRIRGLLFQDRTGRYRLA